MSFLDHISYFTHKIITSNLMSFVCIFLRTSMFSLRIICFVCLYVCKSRASEHQISYFATFVCQTLIFNLLWFLSIFVRIGKSSLTITNFLHLLVHKIWAFELRPSYFAPYPRTTLIYSLDWFWPIFRRIGKFFVKIYMIFVTVQKDKLLGYILVILHILRVKLQCQTFHSFLLFLWIDKFLLRITNFVCLFARKSYGFEP